MNHLTTHSFTRGLNAIGILLTMLGGAAWARGQGTITFANSSTTLISVDNVPMPARTSMETTYYFAIFLASSDTVSSPGQNATFTDPSFQVVGAYNTNSTIGPGRLNLRSNADVGSAGGWVAGSTVDFIVRGWSANAGVTWAEALANWNDGTPLIPMALGSSTVAENMVLSGGTSISFSAFGTEPYQVLGFNMTFIPEPSALALAVLGGTTFWVRIRRRKREPT